MPVRDPQNEFPGVPWIGLSLGMSIFLIGNPEFPGIFRHFPGEGFWVPELRFRGKTELVCWAAVMHLPPKKCLFSSISGCRSSKPRAFGIRFGDSLCQPQLVRQNYLPPSRFLVNSPTPYSSQKCPKPKICPKFVPAIVFEGSQSGGGLKFVKICPKIIVFYSLLILKNF